MRSANDEVEFAPSRCERHDGNGEGTFVVIQRDDIHGFGLGYKTQSVNHTEHRLGVKIVGKSHLDRVDDTYARGPSTRRCLWPSKLLRWQADDVFLHLLTLLTLCTEV